MSSSPLSHGPLGRRTFATLSARLTIPLAFALALSGCVPTTWLPDSSGFIYVKPIKGKEANARATGGELIHYDIAKKFGRVVVPDIGPGTLWPAISPDGKRIAVARFKGAPGQPTTVQLVFWDFQGKPLGKSKEMVWEAAKTKGFSLTSEAMLFWLPKNDMVVVTDMTKTTALYNVQTDAMRVLANTMPFAHAGTPILPDGQGVLLVVSEGEIKDQKAHLAVADWNGAEQRIDTEALEAIVKETKHLEEGVRGLAIMSLVMPSW